jgi:hypothetical protein
MDGSGAHPTFPLVPVKKGVILEPMQGHTACQPKPALYRLDQPKFPAGLVVTAAFPEGGGVVIFIFFPRGNPVKYTDPDGREDEPYNNPPQNLIKVELLYINNGQVFGKKFHHTYIRITGNEDESYTIRGGPENISDNSSDAVKDFSSSGNAVEGNYGNLTISFGENAEDIESGRTIVQSDEFFVEGNFNTIKERLENFGRSINDSEIPYLPVNRNSNSFAFQGIELLTGKRPSASGWAPGSKTRLKVDR